MRKLLRIGLVVSFVVLVVLVCTKGNYGHWATESRAWSYVSTQGDKEAYNKYIEKYPSGNHVNDAKDAISTINKEAEIESAYKALFLDPSTAKCQNFLSCYPNSPYEKSVRNKLNKLLIAELESTYGNSSLKTGAIPYRSWYGGNYSNLYCDYSTIKVTAPYSSDVVVIIKHNNADGKVAAHGYIKAGETLSLIVPNGRYQTFFYYGKGWYPEKQMSGVKGGFLKGEIFSKADSEYVSDVELSYVLQLTTSGNFSTKSSSIDEIF